MLKQSALFLVAMGGLIGVSAHAQTSASTQSTQLLWGDVHLHSNISADAFIVGTTKLGPDASYRFAKGEVVTSSSGIAAKLSRPLDFLSVTDHAEFMGVFAGLTDKSLGDIEITYVPVVTGWRGWIADLTGGPKPATMTIRDALLTTDIGARWNAFLQARDMQGAFLDFVAALSSASPGNNIPEDMRRAIWAAVAGIADRHNEPGVFTAMVGYEWSSISDGNNLHRNVLFRADAATASQVVPFSAIDSADPEDLWAALARFEAETGSQALAIAHNGNLSNGIMFSEVDLKGHPITPDYAARRRRWEPVYEMTQVKGDGETHPFVSPDDPFADFENWDETNINNDANKNADMYQYEYARPALGVGLGIKRRTKINPYEFGFIGSTDSHTALATADSDNYFGKFLDSEPSLARLTNKMAGNLWPNLSLNAAGYIAVWAQENTRAAIFDAIKRREVYASTGPRIALRFFGGWNFTGQDLSPDGVAKAGYADGVPMGALLPSGERTDAPVFLIRADKDPIGANLDRVQVIKGWVDKGGTRRESVYDVALSDGRMLDPGTGKVPPVGNTVDLKTATYENSVGAESFALAWQDPDFDPQVDAFYYLRVLQIPTPRWSTYDAARYGAPIPDGARATLQERAYSSPIWYYAD
ncbi:MAG: DUF3604 domain-containing protein [Pseudomonadota bacterium]